MTAERLLEIRAFIATNPQHATLLQELADAVTLLEKQQAYYVRQVAERYREIVALRRQHTLPRCEDCGAEMVECSAEGDLRCQVCDLEATVKQLRASVAIARVAEDDERGGRR